MSNMCQYEGGCGRKADSGTLCTRHNVERLAKLRGQTECITEGCERKDIYVSGYCKFCIQRIRLGKTLGLPDQRGRKKGATKDNGFTISSEKRFPVPRSTCLVEWCVRLSHGGSKYCSKHAQHIRKYGDIRFDRDVSFVSKTCVVKNCDQQPKSRNLCKTHYEQISRGEALRPIVPNSYKSSDEKGSTTIYRLLKKEMFVVEELLLGIPGYSCEACNEVLPSLDAAHIVPRRNGGSNEQWNRLWLCPTCHRLFDHYEELFWKRAKNSGIIRDRVMGARSKTIGDVNVLGATLNGVSLLAEGGKVDERNSNV